MAQQNKHRWILGVDLGSSSLGWAVAASADGQVVGLLDAGVRVFDSGTEGDREAGREESRNKARRDARLQRRQAWRRGRRLRKVFGLLQHFGLLPSGDAKTPLARQDLLNQLDTEIRTSPWFREKAVSGQYPDPLQTLPYVLRSAALDGPLEPHFLGRALYHLAQRRGFLSNRLRPSKTGAEEEGEVKKSISELRQKIADSGARTLGEYFARLAPSEARIRARWTHRDMYQAEFHRLWDQQAQWHPQVLTPERKRELYRAVFYQRPLKFDPGAIGRCELEPECPRAPAYLLLAQRFRLLQAVNNLRLLAPGQIERPLTPEERSTLLEALELRGDLSFTQVRKLLHLPRNCAFNLERGGEKLLRGNRTAADFHDVFRDRWLQMPPPERDSVVEYVHVFQKPDKLKAAAQRRWGLDEQTATRLSEITLEPDYMNLSRRAMEKLLPLLEQGLTYGEARRRLYPERFAADQPRNFLPPAQATLAAVRNPAVLRSLTELRKVVNALVRRIGKPEEIHIELARDLRASKKQREARAEQMRENEKARKNAARRILEETGIKDPSPEDIRKVLLAEECRWECPYTGKAISMRKLVGPEPEFEIEHIIPFSRSLDNSFLNLTLCHVEENRRKHNQTPCEAYAGDPEKYEAILQRVGRFNGSRQILAEKLRRFRMGPDELAHWLSDFSSRQLADTAYASRLATEYLAVLYGGVVDATGKRRIQATSGQITAYLRNLWLLNTILSDGPTSQGGTKTKARDDHRHHAVDAVAIALTSPATVKLLNDAAQRAPQERRRRFASLPAPWPGFVDSVRAIVQRVVPSHRVSKKVSGALHEETNYSMVAGPDGPRRTRKPLHRLSRTEVAEIADEAVKKLVLERLGDGDPKKVFADSANLPCFRTKDGRTIPIRRVRVNKRVPTFTLGHGRATRHVASESNHHMEIFTELDTSGNEVEWDGVVVSMAEAYRRKQAREPVVQRNFGPHRRFKFSLVQGEIIEWDDESGGHQLFVVRALTEGRVALVPIHDARKKDKLVESGTYIRPALDTLRKRNARKVAVSPLGEVSVAHD